MRFFLEVITWWIEMWKNCESEGAGDSTFLEEFGGEVAGELEGLVCW